MDTEPEASLAISIRPPSSEDRRVHVRAPDHEWLSDPAARGDLPDPDSPRAPGTAIRFESGLKEIDCAPPSPAGWW